MSLLPHRTGSAVPGFVGCAATHSSGLMLTSSIPAAHLMLPLYQFIKFIFTIQSLSVDGVRINQKILGYGVPNRKKG